MHPRLVKWLATFLAEPLANLFSNNPATAVVPGDCKVAVICPIFKKGAPEGVAYYHPVRLILIVSMVFEQIKKAHSLVSHSV